MCYYLTAGSEGQLQRRHDEQRSPTEWTWDRAEGGTVLSMVQASFLTFIIPRGRPAETPRDKRHGIAVRNAQHGRSLF